MKRSVKSSRCRAAPAAQDKSGTWPRGRCVCQACHTGWGAASRCTLPRAEFGHQRVLVEDCGSQPPSCFKQRKVMKRLEGMIYGERLASEESRGRKENSPKVVEITRAAGERWGKMGRQMQDWSLE